VLPGCHEACAGQTERVIIPGTLGQLLAVLLLILPGFVFTAVRARRRGPTPADGEFGQRIFTSIAYGAALDAIYVMAAGRHAAVAFDHQRYTDEWKAHPRLLPLVGFGLLILVPVTLGVLDDLRQVGALDVPYRWGGRSRRLPLRYQGRYDPTPTAWDFAGPPRGGTFVRVRQPDGSWVGGWFGNDSFLSTWPEPHDLFIESQWLMTDDGIFERRLEDTRGVYVSCPQGVVVEWVDPPSPQDPPEGGEPADGEGTKGAACRRRHRGRVARRKAVARTKNRRLPNQGLAS
jgi:hypothetical protein